MNVFTKFHDDQTQICQGFLIKTTTVILMVALDKISFYTAFPGRSCCTLFRLTVLYKRCKSGIGGSLSFRLWVGIGGGNSAESMSVQ